MSGPRVRPGPDCSRLIRPTVWRSNFGSALYRRGSRYATSPSNDTTGKQTMAGVPRSIWLVACGEHPIMVPFVLL